MRREVLPRRFRRLPLALVVFPAGGEGTKVETLLRCADAKAR
jgi:hypothetical protein